LLLNAEKIYKIQKELEEKRLQRLKTPTRSPGPSKYFSVSNFHNCIGGVMVSVLASSAVDRGFEPRLAQSKD
jgi:hypothetical protein